jgi:hypothetical protein
MLPDGTVLIVGGTHHTLLHVFNGCTERPTVLSSAELFK